MSATILEQAEEAHVRVGRRCDDDYRVGLHFFFLVDKEFMRACYIYLDFIYWELAFAARNGRFSQIMVGVLCSVFWLYFCFLFFF